MKNAKVFFDNLDSLDVKVFVDTFVEYHKLINNVIKPESHDNLE